MFVLVQLYLYWTVQLQRVVLANIVFSISLQVQVLLLQIFQELLMKIIKWLELIPLLGSEELFMMDNVQIPAKQ